MTKDRGRHTRRGGGPIRGEDTEGAPGTVRGRAGTAGTEGENVPRADRAPGGGAGSAHGSTDTGVEREQVIAEDENEGVGLSGRGRNASGSLPGSVGGTTGVGAENAGIRSPGSDVPAFPGISPDEAERLRRGKAR